jgi:uncharacterized membrane protein
MRNNRPILSLERSPLELFLEIIAFLGVLAGIIIIAKYWPSLPEIIPVHFGVDGKANSWGNKSIILMLPLLAFIMDVGAIFLSNYPHTFNYPVRITPENAARQYQLARGLLLGMKIEMIWMFAFMDWQIVQASLGQIQGLSVGFIFAMITVNLVTVGFYFFQANRDR